MVIKYKDPRECLPCMTKKARWYGDLEPPCFVRADRFEDVTLPEENC